MLRILVAVLPTRTTRQRSPLLLLAVTPRWRTTRTVRSFRTSNVKSASVETTPASPSRPSSPTAPTTWPPVCFCSSRVSTATPTARATSRSLPLTRGTTPCPSRGTTKTSSPRAVHRTSTPTTRCSVATATMPWTARPRFGRRWSRGSTTPTPRWTTPRRCSASPSTSATKAATSRRWCSALRGRSSTFTRPTWQTPPTTTTGWPTAPPTMKPARHCSGRTSSSPATPWGRAWRATWRTRAPPGACGLPSPLGTTVRPRSSTSPREGSSTTSTAPAPDTKGPPRPRMPSPPCTCCRVSSRSPQGHWGRLSAQLRGGGLHLSRTRLRQCLGRRIGNRQPPRDGAAFGTRGEFLPCQHGRSRQHADR